MNEPADTRTFYVRQKGGEVQGPFPATKIRRWLESGKLRPEMSISEDRESWVRCMGELALPDGPIEVAGLSDREEAPDSTASEGLSCLGVLLLIVLALCYACSGSSEDEPDYDPDAVPGVYKAERFFDGMVSKTRIDTWVVMFQGGRFEWYEKWITEDTWKLKMDGTWSSETRKYTDTGDEYTGLSLTKRGESGPGFYFSHRRGRISANRPTESMLGVLGLHRGLLNKTGDDQDRPSPR